MIRAPIAFVLLLLCAHGASGGKVKKALFGAIFGEEEEKPHREKQPGEGLDPEQLELQEFLKEIGFPQYASTEFINELDDELAYDCIEDLTHIIADDEYDDLDITREEAMTMQDKARRRLLQEFLASVPVPEGEAADLYAKQLDVLIEDGYDEPDDVADLDFDEAKELLGLDQDHAAILINHADEYEARALLQLIIETHKDAAGVKPFASEATWRPMVETLVKAGVRTLADLAKLVAVPGLAAEDLARLQSDSRVRHHGVKQEL